ncbi:MAG TPA: glycosyltransferase family 39 protein, partial [Pyrinomonadaceae bacterium]|nr:glycosyltransferase family 39 protein [Pyrinomonadaceae bacterium]
LAVMSLQMFAVIARKSITVDEIVLIPAGYYHLAAGNHQLVNEHPPLAKFIAGIPTLFIQPGEVKPEQIHGAPGSIEERWAYAERFWENNPELFASLSFWPRVPAILLTVVVGLLIFQIARELFGPLAAVLAVALFTLEPTVLAHGRVVQTDMPATLGYFLLFMTLFRYTSKPSPKTAAWVGAATGVALLAKFSMLLAGPVLLVLFAVMIWRAPQRGLERRTLLAQALILALAAIITINAGYLFQHRAVGTPDAQWIQESFSRTGGKVTMVTSLLAHIIPADFLLGILRQVRHNNEGHPAGLLGRYSRTGWWYYFPVAFALKTTLPFLLISIASLVWASYQWIKKREPRFIWMLAPVLVYTAYVLGSRIDIGVRYCLPAYPFLFILGGALLAGAFRSLKLRRAGMFVAIIVMAWTVAEAVRAFPNHMSYMNQLASARPHWWYLSDSNVEWGDDAPQVAEYLRARGESRVRSAFLGDFIMLHHYGVQPLELANPDGVVPEPTRYTAIGAGFLNGSIVPEAIKIQGRWVTETERRNFFDAYRGRAPEAIIGGSVYLFRDEPVPVPSPAGRGPQ